MTMPISDILITAHGVPGVWVDGRAVAFRTSRALHLALYLALCGPTSRDELGDTLWPHLSSERQHANVRLCLHYIRAVVPGLVIEDAKTLRLGEARIDHPECVAFVRSAGPDQAGELIAMIGQPMLQGCDEPWAANLRDAWNSLVAEGGLQLAHRLLESDPRMTIALLQPLSGIDPYRDRIPVLTASAWVRLAEHAKAREVIRDYARFIKGELGMNCGDALLLEVGLELPTERPSAPVRVTLSGRQQCRLALARAPAWLVASQLQLGMRRLREALETRVARGALRAELLATLSRFQSEAGEFAEAETTAREALALARSGGGRTWAGLALARSMIYRGDLLGARTQCDSVTDGGRRLEPEASAEVEAILSAVANQEDDLGAAEAHANRSLRWAVRAESPFHQVVGLNLLGSALFKARLWDRAREAHQEAADIGKACGARARTGHALNSLGRCLEAQGDLRGAARLYEQSLECLSELESKEIFAMTMTYLGNLRLRLGDPAAALEAHCKALACRRLAGDSWGRATSLRCVARALLALSRLDEAERDAHAASHLAESMGDALGVAMSEVVLAHVFKVQGRRDRAQRAAESALRFIAGPSAPVRHLLAEDPIYGVPSVQAFLKSLASPA